LSTEKQESPYLQAENAILLVILGVACCLCGAFKLVTMAMTERKGQEDAKL
jgi:hypothetical protein